MKKNTCSNPENDFYFVSVWLMLAGLILPELMLTELMQAASTLLGSGGTWWNYVPLFKLNEPKSISLKVDVSGCNILVIL